jgi:UDP-N-acetylmuramate dehydrogenase
VRVCEQVPLAGYTTLGVGGPAARFVEADSDEQIVSAVRAADRRGDQLLVLGGGSNVLIADTGFPGTVVKVATSGITAAADGDGVAVSVAAGEDWDAVVRWSVGSGLSGLECLSGIPGLAGATPIQNVGAYGQDVAETVLAVRAYDRRRGELAELSNADCRFGYRTSFFKRAAARAGTATGRHVVLGVTFRLARDPLSAPVRYGELARCIGVAEGARVPLADVREAVLRLRRGKGMVLDPADPDTRSAGSFFTNPVLGKDQFAALERAVAAVCGGDARVPAFPAGPGRVKVPAAWLIERAGFRKGYPGNGQPAADSEPGHQAAGPRISAKHTLALVNPGGATATSLLALARDIRDGVRETFGVELVTEPALVGEAL